MGAARDWLPETGDGFEGRHPLTGQHFQIRSIGEAADVWLDGQRLRRCDSLYAALSFVESLVQSEYDRADDEEAAKTPADRAADLAAAVDTLWRYRMTRPYTAGTSTESMVQRLARFYESDVARLALPLVTDPLGAKALGAWLAEAEGA